jgi:uncharacterized protein YoxC
MPIPISDFTVIIVAISFIVVLIILAKISSQLDEMVNMSNNIQRKMRETYEVAKWDFDKIKEKMAELKGEDIQEYIRDKNSGEKEIEWKE